jgi:chromosome segregation protein
MRLSRVKLAGFKSFVDPTVVAFPGNLTGVVGPNGCGKSNVIDAVRWVMGEISAKTLRGESMTDVIFNGSRDRKPVGTASVELVFDNADGAIGGAYANYAEISLKRVVSRDGNSTYLINGTRCRRKDITHLFLGTGLGSRSYAIIEQGMISRLIEARAEDMRAFIEEAAGISRYKDRRRETETRISHTRENLERLNDLREEVDRQIRNLQRQAGAARRYQEYRERQQRLQAELLALRIRELDRDTAERELQAAGCETTLQAETAGLRAAEAAVERARALHAERSEQLNAVQGRYYQAGAEATRTEQALQHARELRQRQRADFERITAEHSESSGLLERDQQQLAVLTTALSQAEPALAAARADHAAAAATAEGAEAAMQDWQQRSDEASRAAGDTAQRTLVERTRIEQIETRLARLLAQRERLEQERGHLEQLATGSEQELVAAEAQAREAGDAARGALEATLSGLQAERAAEKDIAGELDRVRGELQAARGELVSAEALQKAALGLVQGRVVEWLASHRLESRPRLAQRLEVEAGWERAVETALGSYLEAVCTEGLGSVLDIIDGLQVGQVAFAETSGTETAPAAAGSLRSRVAGPAVLEGLLEGIIAVDRLSEALARRGDLRPGQSIITRDGVWIGRDWLRVARDQDAHSGVLVREQDLRRLRAAVAGGEARVAEQERGLAARRQRVIDLDRQREEQQIAVNRSHHELVTARGALESMRARAQHAGERLARLQAEVQQAGAEMEHDAAEVRAARQRLEAGLAELQAHERRRAALDSEREVLRERLGAARGQLAGQLAALREAEIRAEAQRSTIVSVRTSLERIQEQVRQLAARRTELEAQVAGAEQPLAGLEAELQQQLERRLVVERELAESRRSVDEADASVREQDAGRHQAETRVETARTALAEVSLGLQEARVRREALLEQFAGTHLDLAEVGGGLPAEATVLERDQELTEVTERIERLGAVNLASIDELREQSARKEYLDRQFTDLTDALGTLELAIRKIDRETRTRFQDTFDRINAGLQEKFPRLFGGGSAYLELSGDDPLTAGVTVMARPPGKRNSTISQLSGGEKALTAVALVFSIFELNPAPFCLLDEVDAPLDDHNVGRFCDIVREMSARVQFMFITHNKSTMELAGQLIGVTMSEPGVSRLVAVDVDEAVRLAAAG